jgi:hypothetical protein
VDGDRHLYSITIARENFDDPSRRVSIKVMLNGAPQMTLDDLENILHHETHVAWVKLHRAIRLAEVGEE